MTVKESARLARQYAVCPVCGNDTVGSGKGTLEVDTATGLFRRKCACGWSIEIKGLTKIRRPDYQENELGRRDELFDLMRQHPELPVVPMVDSEIVADDCCARWIGSWGKARIDRYWVGDNGVYFYEEDGPDDTAINDPACAYDWDTLTDEQAQEVYDCLPWTACIVVNIDLPRE